jgi:UDP-N-acetylmuramoyl-tripeptide--D-alanyl-D-alanine ligase
VDDVVAIGGPAAQELAEAAVISGFILGDVHYFKTSGEAADAWASYVHDGDLVLVKGSRGIRTDIVVDRLKAEFA